MNYKEKYEEALERAKGLLEGMDEGNYFASNEDIENIFPELKEKESEDEKIRKEIIRIFKGETRYTSEEDTDKYVTWLEKQGEPKDKGEISDGYHTFNELYEYRKLYNAAFFNLLPKRLVHKSKRHHDGEECFGGGWFIVMANLPTGQISNHYKLKDWDLFKIPEKEVADEWDGHTPQDAANRLHKYLLGKQGGEKPTDEVEPKFKVGDWIVDDDFGYVWEITEIQNKYYNLEGADGCCSLPTIEFDDEHFHLWTITDAKDGDVLVDDSCIFIIQKLRDNSTAAKTYCTLHNDGDFDNGSILYFDIDSTKPATKEQRDLLFQKMKEAGYGWDAEKKELKKIEPKTLDADKVIEWLKTHGNLVPVVTIRINEVIAKFKEDFGL